MDDSSDVTIPDTKQKLWHLRTDPQAKNLGKHGGSKRSFAGAIGVHPSTADGWTKSERDGGTRTVVLTSEQNASIATCFKFPVNWEPWLAKSFDVFKTAFAAHATAILSAEVGTARWTPPSIEQQFLDRVHALRLQEQFGADVGEGEFAAAQHAMIFEKVAASTAERTDAVHLRSIPEPHKERAVEFKRFASISFPRDLRNEFSLPFPMRLDLTLGENNTGRSLKSCEVRFRFSADAKAPSPGERPNLSGTLVALQNQERLPQRRLTVEHYGEEGSPWIIVSVTRPPLGAISLVGVFDLSDVTDGERVEAVMVVRLKDLAPSSS